MAKLYRSMVKAQNIRAVNIDKIDDINKSGTLEGITFYQGNYEYNKEEDNDDNDNDNDDDDDDDDDNNDNDDNKDKVKDKEKKKEKDKEENENENEDQFQENNNYHDDFQYQDSNKETEYDSTDSELEKCMIALESGKESILNENTRIMSEYEINDEHISSLSLQDELNNYSISDKNTMYNSHYFGFDNQQREFILDISDLVKEICVILFLHLLLRGIHNAIFNIMTIDGIITSIIFYIKYKNANNKIIKKQENNVDKMTNKNFLLKNRMMTLDRYIYYFVLFCGYYILNYMTWFHFTDITMYIASVMVCPSIMRQINDMNAYKKIRHVFFNGYHRLIKKIICKQMTKIINLILINVLNINTAIKSEDLIPHYDLFSWMIVNKFIITFVLACIFNYMDKGGMKFPLMIYKKLYLKDKKYNISDDKIYVKKIIVDKEWKKFTDVYTLNRIIRTVFNDDVQNSKLSDHIYECVDKVIFRINKIALCWTIMNITNLSGGILAFLLFISSTERPLKYIINTFLFFVLSFYTDERILLIILCELFYPIVDSKLLTDIKSDIIISVKRGFMKLYYRTRLESVLLSLSLSYLSFIKYNNIGVLIVAILNLFVMLRMFCMMFMKNEFNSKYLLSKIFSFVFALPSSLRNNNNNDINTNLPPKIKKIKQLVQYQTSLLTKCDVNNNKSNQTQRINTSSQLNDAFDINNVIFRKSFDNYEVEASNTDHDILLVTWDMFKIILKNNLLIKVLNPLINLEIDQVIRIFSHLFTLLILGNISNFHVIHIMFLPIVVQNVIDILFHDKEKSYDD